MSNLKDKNKNKILPNQNRCLPIILWLFPLLLLNIGWYFFSYIDYSWIKSEWIEQSQREAESFAASSDSVYCMGKIAGNFFDELKKDVESFSKKNQNDELLNNIASHASEILKKPFPEHNLFVFRISADNNKTELIYHNVENLIGKRAIGFAFEYFAKTNLPDKKYKTENKSGFSMAKTFLGSECDPSIIAKTQRGKVSYSIYNNKPHYFFWDYLKYEETGDIYGLFLLIENNVNAEIGSKLIALRELKNNSEGGKNNYGAFIPLFPGYGGVIANEEFAKMPEYKRLTREWVPKNIDDLYSWQFKDTSKLFEKTRVGNYQAFFHIMAGQSHAAVLLKPILDKAKLPFWLYLLNILLISIIILLLLRGFIQGVWPNISLKFRFITTYFLAACMPLGLLIIASYGYISAYQHSAYFDKLSKLRFCINQFDIRKIKKQEDYKTAYLDILNDSNFQESIKRFDKANSNNPKEFPIEAKDVLNCALGILRKGSRDLPVLALSIIDERGNYFSNYSKDDFQIFNLLGGERFSTKEYLSPEEEKSRDINEKAISILMHSFLKPMREKILKVAPKTKKWDREYTPTLYQETASGGFKNAAGGRGDLTKVLDEHRNIIFDRLVGDRIISHIFDNIFINGIPRFVLFFTWDLAELDKETFMSSLNYFAIKEPDLVFFAFETGPSGVKEEPWIDSGRHGQDFVKNSLDLANQAYFSGDNVSRRYETMSVIAVPSKKYKDKIIVGCVSHNDLKMPVFERMFVCATIIAIATIIFLFCIYYSFKIFLKPISNLKQVLDKVADGNLDIEIKSSSKDEFGIMSHEFSVMTRELSERNKLATLLSDHAVEALSKNEYAEGVNTDVEKFNGTALVTDIRNFTGMCEKYEPEQITDLLNEHFACMTKIFASNGGRIYKYIGDAIEVVFSDNDNFEKNSVERAFLASVQMLEALNKINNKRVSNNLFEYKIGVGLCYGSMYSGSIGSLETRLDYAILCDALKNAAKLESMSKLNPEFPLIVDENFISYFKNFSDKIIFSFVKSEDGLKGYKVDNSCKDVLPNIISTKENSEPENFIIDKLARKDITLESNTSTTDSYKIEDDISLERKFILASIFILLFISILTLGIFFTNKYRKDFKKNELIANNKLIIEQMLGDHYGKVAFDSKCRLFAKKIQEKINELEPNEKYDEIITKTLNDCYNSDLSIKELGLNSVFVRIGNYNDNDIKEDDLSTYLSRVLPVYPVGNRGYNEKELKQICDTYRIIHLKDKEIIKSKLEEELKSKYENISEIDFRDKLIYFYENPCRKLFGDKIVISRLDGDLINTTTEAVTREKNCFLYTLNFYHKNSNNILGYLVISMPAEKAYKSIPFILSAFSKNNENIILKNKDSNEWYFSESIPSYVKDKIKSILQEKKYGDSYSEIIKYLDSEGCILNEEKKEKVKIDNQFYEIYMVGLFGQNNIFSIKDYLIICLFFFLLLWVLKNILKNTSIFNKSIAAKLWLAFLIVAVIPALTVFFVPSLFLNESLSVNNSLKRGEMQRFMGIYERKMDFFLPITWNDLKKKNHSVELNNYIDILNNSDLSKKTREKAMHQLRSMVETWLDSDKRYSKDDKIKNKERAIIGYKFTDFTISGKGGWSFCFSDGEKNDSIENRPINLASIGEKGTNNKDSTENVFGSMIKIIAKSLLDKKLNEDKENKVDSRKVANELAVETGFDTIRVFYGDDTFIKLLHGINIMTLFDIGFGKMGFMIVALPDYKNPKAIMVWVINFDNYHYLEKNIDKVESDFSIFTAEPFRYGIVANRTDDNNLRIPIGEYASWIAASNNPISANIELNNEKYLLEGAPGLKQFNSLFIALFSEKEFIEEVNKLALVFYILLAFSLIIIIINTKIIADDIINPIKALITGIKEVNRENFSFRINSDRTDELGTLCLSFDRMTKGLDEKRMMSRMLSKTARMVTLEDRTVTSGKTDAVLLYVGVPDFSKVMKSFEDYEVFEELKKHTAVMAGLIMDEGGEVDKIIGEKMLAVFRVNNNETEIAMAAYRVAKKMLELEKTNQLSFSISIGLNYGKVINGFLGVGNKRDFTVIGDPVNVTARIESLAESLESNRCLISETFYKLVDNSITAKIYGEVELKGKSQPMKVYNLL